MLLCRSWCTMCYTLRPRISVMVSLYLCPNQSSNRLSNDGQMFQKPSLLKWSGELFSAFLELRGSQCKRNTYPRLLEFPLYKQTMLHPRIWLVIALTVAPIFLFFPPYGEFQFQPGHTLTQSSDTLLRH